MHLHSVDFYQFVCSIKNIKTMPLHSVDFYQFVCSALFLGLKSVLYVYISGNASYTDTLYV